MHVHKIIKQLFPCTSCSCAHVAKLTQLIAWLPQVLAMSCALSVRSHAQQLEQPDMLYQLGEMPRCTWHDRLPQQ